MTVNRPDRWLHNGPKTPTINHRTPGPASEDPLIDSACATKLLRGRPGTPLPPPPSHRRRCHAAIPPNLEINYGQALLEMDRCVRNCRLGGRCTNRLTLGGTFSAKTSRRRHTCERKPPSTVPESLLNESAKIRTCRATAGRLTWAKSNSLAIFNITLSDCFLSQKVLDQIPPEPPIWPITHANPVSNTTIVAGVIQGHCR